MNEILFYCQQKVAYDIIQEIREKGQSEPEDGERKLGVITMVRRWLSSMSSLPVYQEPSLPEEQPQNRYSATRPAGTRRQTTHRA